VGAASPSGAHPSATAGSAGTTVGEGSSEADALDRDAKVFATLGVLRQRLAEIEAGTADRGLDRGGVDSQPSNLRAEIRAAPWAEAAASYPTPAVALRSAPRPGRRIARRRRAATVIGTAALAAVGAASYFVFDQRQLVDASKAPSVTGEVKGGGDSAKAASPASSDRTSAEATPSGSAAPPLSRVTHGVAPTQQGSASRPGGAAQREGPVTSAAPAVTTSAGARPETSAGIERPPPNRLGPCTDAVAALGLCAPEPTQRRE
jgi:hypothetical protein